MRSFLAGLLVLVAAVVSAGASVAYVAHQTVLDPAHSGAVLAKALEQRDLRDEVLARAVPGYDRLPAPYRHTVARAARSHRVDRALRRVRVDAGGRLHLGAVRRQVARTLRANGQPLLAARLAALRGRDTIRLPSAVASQYVAARHRSWWAATRGAAAAAILFLAALLVAPNRRLALGAIGVALMLSTGATLLVYSRLPDFAAMAGRNPWVGIAATAARASTSTVVSLLLPVLIGGAALLVGSFLVPRRR